MPRSSRLRRTVLCVKSALTVLALTAFTALPGSAQESPPTVRGVLTGYGAFGYTAVTDGDLGNNFTALLAPVTLFQVGEDLLVEGEIEIELEGNVTEVHLEHAQVHYLGFENVQFTAGMGHMPFGFWKHANWVNKMPAAPVLFEDTHGFPATDNLMPIFFDLGLKAETNFQLADGWMGTASAWVSQGPAPGDPAGHTHGGEPADGHAHDHGPTSSVPALGYGGNFSDNNSDKMVGARFRAVSSGGLIFQGSGFRAKYDEAGDLGIRGLNGAVAWAPGDGPVPRFDLRVEGTILDQEFRGPGGVESVDYGGYYVQLSRRFGDFEPVVRWGQLPRTVAGGGVVVPKRRQLALGLNYVLSPSVPVKLAYHLEDDREDSFLIEWAVGF